MVLNRPSPNGVEITVEGKKIIKPIMFGGEFSMKNSPPLLWLHNSKVLKDLSVGQPLGLSGLLWKCTAQEALKSIEAGKGKVEDFIIVSGVSVWTKGEKGIVRGIQGEIQRGKFQVVGRERLGAAWERILSQKTVGKDSLYRAAARSEEIWRGCITTADELGDQRTETVYKSKVTTTKLADEALRNWVRMFMVGMEEEESEK